MLLHGALILAGPYGVRRSCLPCPPQAGGPPLWSTEGSVFFLTVRAAQYSFVPLNQSLSNYSKVRSGAFRGWGCSHLFFLTDEHTVVCEATNPGHQNTKLEAISRTTSVVMPRRMEGALFGTKVQVTLIRPDARNE
jgi:hypothetical protein